MKSVSRDFSVTRLNRTGAQTVINRLDRHNCDKHNTNTNTNYSLYLKLRRVVVRVAELFGRFVP